MALTSRLGTTDATLLGASLGMGVPGALGDPSAVDNLNLTEEAIIGTRGVSIDAFANTDSADVGLDSALAAVDTLSMTDEAFNQKVESEDTLVLTEVVGLGWDGTSTAIDTLALSELAIGGIARAFFAVDTLTLTESADIAAEALDTLVLTELAEAAESLEDAFANTDSVGAEIEFNTSCVDSLTLTESVDNFMIMLVDGEDELDTFELQFIQEFFIMFPVKTGLRDTAEVHGAVPPTFATDNIFLSESTIGSWVLSPGGFSETATDTLALTEKAPSVVAADASDTLVLTESTTATSGPRASDTLTLSDTATATMDYATLAGVDTLTLSEGLSFSIELVDIECRYSPFVGTNTDPNAPPPPPTTYQAAGGTAGFRLQFPETGAVTDEVLIRDPSFGNKDRLHFSRVNHETRGGTLIIYADPIWPKTENQIFSFSHLKTAKKDEIEAFIEGHLGVEIRLIDHEDRLWRGVIIQVQDPMVEDLKDRFTMSFEFEGAKV